MRHVRTYSFDTKKVVEIPEAELGPPMIGVHVSGVGDVYVDTRELKPGTVCRHPPFPLEKVKYIQQIGEDLAEVLPQRCRDNWVDGFRYDTNPEREIAIWRRIADVYRMFTRRPMSLPVKKECFQLLLTCTSAEPSTVLLLTPTSLLSRVEAEQIVDAYSALCRAAPIDPSTGSGKLSLPDSSADNESNSFGS